MAAHIIVDNGYLQFIQFIQFSTLLHFCNLIRENLSVNVNCRLNLSLNLLIFMYNTILLLNALNTNKNIL